MAIYPAGFLDLNSGDDSVILECEMTSEANITANSGTLQTGATVDFDGVLPGSAGAVQFDLSALDFASLDDAGQMSFEIETSGIGELHTSVGSDGYDHTGNDYIAHWNDAAGVIPPYGRILINANESWQVELNTSDADTVFSGPHTLGAGRYTRYTLSWIGGVYTSYMNGVEIATKTRVGFNASKFTYIQLGSLLNGTSPIAAPARFKNFLISNRPVMIPKHPRTQKIIFWGDSFVTNADKTVSTTYYHCSAEDTFRRYLLKKGINASMIIDGNSGYEVWDGATNALQDVRAALLAQNPQIVLMQAGTNDAVRNPLEAAFEADYQDHITTIMAHATVERMIIGKIPTLKGNKTYDSPTYVANVKTLNDIIDSLPAWWDTNNPSNTGKVTIADTFIAFGGEEPLDNVFVGQVAGTFGDYHPGAKGQSIMGETFAAALVNVLQ